MPTSTVSSKMQITLPAAIRRALGIKPGDRLELRVVGDHVELRKIRPNPAAVARAILEEMDFQPLREETGGDAVRHVRDTRWGDDQP